MVVMVVVVMMVIVMVMVVVMVVVVVARVMVVVVVIVIVMVMMVVMVVRGRARLVRRARNRVAPLLQTLLAEPILVRPFVRMVGAICLKFSLSEPPPRGDGAAVRIRDFDFRVGPLDR